MTNTPAPNPAYPPNPLADLVGSAIDHDAMRAPVERELAWYAIGGSALALALSALSIAIGPRYYLDLWFLDALFNGCLRALYSMAPWTGMLALVGLSCDFLLLAGVPTGKYGRLFCAAQPYLAAVVMLPAVASVVVLALHVALVLAICGLFLAVLAAAASGS